MGERELGTGIELHFLPKNRLGSAPGGSGSAGAFLFTKKEVSVFL